MKKGVGSVRCKVLGTILLLQTLFLAVAESGEVEAEDCAWYQGDNYTKIMSQVLSTGVEQKGVQFAASLSLTSQNFERSCHISILTDNVGISCGSNKMKIYKWSPELFKERDITELWVHLGSLGEPTAEVENEQDEGRSPISTDLAVIGRRGAHRGHILYPSSGLQPPITVRWKPMQPMSYYYNCVTGCLSTKSAITPPGAHSIFFRPGIAFSQLMVTYVSPVSFTEHFEILNASDVSLDDHWKNLTVVWNKQDGGIGVLIDGLPMKGLRSFSALGKNNGIEADIEGEGSLLRLCDPRFKSIAHGIEQAPSYSYMLKSAPLDDTDARSMPDVSKDWLVILALACIGLLFLAAIVLLILLLRTKRQLQQEKDTTDRNNIAVDTLTATRASTVKSTTASLYPDPQQETRTKVSSSSGGNSNHFTYNGSKT